MRNAKPGNHLNILWRASSIPGHSDEKSKESKNENKYKLTQTPSHKPATQNIHNLKTLMIIYHKSTENATQ